MISYTNCMTQVNVLNEGVVTGDAIRYRGLTVVS